MAEPVCIYCGHTVEPSHHGTFARVIGWERKGYGDSRRGGSDIVLREPVPDMFACQFCIDKLKAGVNVAQETLL